MAEGGGAGAPASDDGSPVGPRREVDPAQIGARIYPLLNSVIVPRPIAWVSTTSADGVDNVAPHSYFTVSSVAPPVVQFTSVGHHDSLRNAEATGEFVVNIATEPLAELVNATSVNAPAEVSEFALTGLAKEPSAVVGPPRVAASPVAIECRLVDTRSFGASVVVFGEVVHVSIAESVLRSGIDIVGADITLLAPVARMGYDEWCTVGRVLELTRPRWPQ